VYFTLLLPVNRMIANNDCELEFSGALRDDLKRASLAQR